jgi:hypothetical protein
MFTTLLAVYKCLFSVRIYFQLFTVHHATIQDLKLKSSFKNRHCTTCFGLLGHHKVRWNLSELLYLPCNCDRWFRIYSVAQWSKCRSYFYAICIDFFGTPVAYHVCSVDVIQLSIQYTCSYPLYRDIVSCTCNLRTHLVMMTWHQINMARTHNCR